MFAKQISLVSLCLGFLFWPVDLADAQRTMAVSAEPLPERPQRIVSINPCADALLLHLADPDHIAAISHYSHDPRATSIPLNRALQFPATSGTAEEILAMRPDVVVASAIVSPATGRALKRLGIPLIKLSIPQSVAESQQQIRALATAIGAPERGRQLNAAISRALADAKPDDDSRIPALIWRSGGLVPGADTLPGELMRRTGFENISATYGLAQWDILPLELLVARPPRVLFSNAPNRADDGWHPQDRKLSHPVLAKLSRTITIAHYPGRLLNCAGPSLIEAAGTLAAARRKVMTQ